MSSSPEQLKAANRLMVANRMNGNPEDTVVAASRPVGGVSKDAVIPRRRSSWMMIQKVALGAQEEPSAVASQARRGSSNWASAGESKTLLAVPNRAWTKARTFMRSWPSLRPDADEPSTHATSDPDGDSVTRTGSARPLGGVSKNALMTPRQNTWIKAFTFGGSFKLKNGDGESGLRDEQNEQKVNWLKMKSEQHRKDELLQRIVFELRIKYNAAIKKEDHTAQCSVAINISRSYSKAGRAEEAESWLTQALDICVEQDLSKPIFLGALRSLVQFHLEAPNPPKAITNGTVLLRAAQDAEDEHYQGEAYRLLAAAHMAQGDRETAQNMDVKHLALALKEARWEVETLSDSACGRLIKGDAVRGDSAAAWEALGLQPGPVGHHSAAGRYLSSLGTSHTSLVTSRTASVINGNNPILARIPSTARRASVASMSVPSINANVPSINANNPIFARISSAGKQPA